MEKGREKIEKKGKIQRKTRRRRKEKWKTEKENGEEERIRKRNIGT